MADKHLCISGRNPRRSGSAPLLHPGVYLSHIRMSIPLTPGSRVAIQVVFGKRNACLDEKRSRFTYSAPIPDRSLFFVVD